MSSLGTDSRDPTPPPVPTTLYPSSSSCAEAPLLTLPVQEIVKQAVGWLASSDRVATVPVVSTPHAMLAAAATSIADDSTTVAILPPDSHALVRKVVDRVAAHEKALQELGHNGPLRVRITADSPLPSSLRPIPPPTTKSRARMKKLREKTAAIGNSEPYLTIRTPCAERFFPSLPTAILSLRYDDYKIADPSFTVTGNEIPIVWDTGSPITRVSIHAVSKQFLDGLLSPDYTAKNPEEGTVFSVDGFFAFLQRVTPNILPGAGRSEAAERLQGCTPGPARINRQSASAADTTGPVSRKRSGGRGVMLGRNGNPKVYRSGRGCDFFLHRLRQCWTVLRYQ